MQRLLTTACALGLGGVSAGIAQPDPAEPLSSPEPPPSQARFGEYTVHFSAFPSEALPDAAALEHAVPHGEGTMLLIVSVERDRTNVPADVNVRATNLAAQITDIEMHEVVSNGEVSYLGAFDVEYRSTVDFAIEVVVAGREAPFQIEFREQFL